jgi:hypothetical protein
MTNPTNPFNWQMPTASDLVTDLPADFETFGQAVATSMADLLGGTTGQVLSKASNTDMDFTWVAQDDSNAIQNAIVDAKGDLIAASAADTPARLAVGANGETLVADSSTSTGLRWQVPVNSNPVLNSAMQVFQRGTSVAVGATNAYTADRWKFVAGGAINYTISQQATGDTTNLPFIQYAARVQRNSGQTGTVANYFIQGIETINSVPYAGKTVTFSFYARKGANFSATSDVLTYLVAYGTGTDQDPAGAYTGQANAINTTATLTTTWQRFTATAAIPSTATEIKTFFTYTPTGTAGTNDYYEVTGVQLEVGSVATPFKTYAGTIQGELAACQRYYWRSTASTLYGTLGVGIATSTTNANVQMKCPVTMRVTPTSIDYSTIGNLRLTEGVGGFTCTGTLILSGESSPEVPFVAGVTSTGLTQYRTYFLSGNNSAAAFVGFSAEL